MVWHVPSRHLFNTLDVGFQAHRALNSDTSRTQIYGAELNVEIGPIQLLGAFEDASIGASPSRAGYYRQGYYLQPSYRIAPPLFVVARYEWLNRDSRDPEVNRMGKQSLGLTRRNWFLVVCGMLLARPASAQVKDGAFVVIVHPVESL